MLRAYAVVARSGAMANAMPTTRPCGLTRGAPESPWSTQRPARTRRAGLAGVVEVLARAPSPRGDGRGLDGQGVLAVGVAQHRRLLAPLTRLPSGNGASPRPGHVTAAPGRHWGCRARPSPAEWSPSGSSTSVSAPPARPPRRGHWSRPGRARPSSRCPPGRARTPGPSTFTVDASAGASTAARSGSRPAGARRSGSGRTG